MARRRRVAAAIRGRPGAAFEDARDRGGAGPVSLPSALVTSLAQLVSPLTRALADPTRLGILLAELDRPVELPDADLDRIVELLPVLEPAQELLDLAVRFGDGSIETGDLIAQGAPLAQEVLDGIAALRDLSAADVQALAAPLDDPATWQGIATDLPEYLFVQWLESWHPLVAALLELGGGLTPTGAPRGPPGGAARSRGA